jgi:uncharacterized protein (DUF1015 family)
MADIRPFRAYRYDAARFPLAQVLTQPYDKITPAMQERYYAASPYNLVAVEKGKSFPGDSAANSVYARAAARLDEWIREGALRLDAAPAIYVYAQEFTSPGSHARRLRRGFIALGRIEDYERRVVFRHERTLTAPKADRLDLLRATRTQTGQLFMLYDDPRGEVDALLESAAGSPPAAQMQDEYGVEHRLWTIVSSGGAETVQRIREAMAAKPLIIADGHHRYETALTYRNECREQLGTTDPEAPHEFAMMTLFNLRAPGLVILPTHRLIRNLPGLRAGELREKLMEYFDVQPRESGEGAVSKLIGEMEQNRERHAMGILDGGLSLLTLRRDAQLADWLPELAPAQRSLDVVLLHRLILERCMGITAKEVAGESYIAYVRSAEEAGEAVQSGTAQAAFLLNPVRIEEMVEIALAGDVMPQKSTDFFPKLLSGLAIYRLHERE